MFVAIGGVHSTCFKQAVATRLKLNPHDFVYRQDLLTYDRFKS